MATTTLAGTNAPVASGGAHDAAVRVVTTDRTQAGVAPARPGKVSGGEGDVRPPARRTRGLVAAARGEGVMWGVWLGKKEGEAHTRALPLQFFRGKTGECFESVPDFPLAHSYLTSQALPLSSCCPFCPPSIPDARPQDRRRAGGRCVGHRGQGGGVWQGEEEREEAGNNAASTGAENARARGCWPAVRRVPHRPRAKSRSDVCAWAGSGSGRREGRVCALPARCRTAHQPRTPHPPTQPIVHVAFIPAIIVLGLLYTEPRPSLAQLLTPM